jgi:hypothetical protein
MNWDELDPIPVFLAPLVGTRVNELPTWGLQIVEPLRSGPGTNETPEPGECPDDRPDTGMLYPRG